MKYMSKAWLAAFAVLMIVGMPVNEALTALVSSVFLVAAWVASGWLAAPADLQMHLALQRTKTVLGELEENRHDRAAHSNT